MIRVSKRKNAQIYDLYSKKEIYLGFATYQDGELVFDPSPNVVFRAKSLERIAKIMTPIKDGFFDD